MASAETRTVQQRATSIDVRVVKALAHPTRVRILNVLRDRELASPVELSGELGLALGTVGYHVRRLETLGFIELAKRTQRRGAVEHHYRACTVLHSVQDRPEPQPDAPHGAAAIALAREAQAAVARGGFDAVAARSDVRSLLLDGRGRAQAKAAIERLAVAAARIERASARRLAAAGEAADAHRCVAAAVLAFDVAFDVS